MKTLRDLPWRQRRNESAKCIFWSLYTPKPMSVLWRPIVSMELKVQSGKQSSCQVVPGGNSLQMLSGRLKALCEAIRRWATAITCGLEDQREEVVGVERATQQELEPWWGCLSWSWDHRETGFLGGSRTTEESRPETPLNAKSGEEGVSWLLLAS